MAFSQEFVHELYKVGMWEINEWKILALDCKLRSGRAVGSKMLFKAKRKT